MLLGYNVQLLGNTVFHGYATKIGWAGKRSPPLHWDPREQVFLCAQKLSLPGGCDMVMWHHGTSRPPLEIVLASVCGLALPNYCICSAEFWTAGSSQSCLSAARKQLNQRNKSSTSYFPKQSRSCLSELKLFERSQLLWCLIFTLCSGRSSTSRHFSSGTWLFKKFYLRLKTWEHIAEPNVVERFFSMSKCSFLSCLFFFHTGTDGLTLSCLKWCRAVQTQWREELQGQVARSSSLSNSGQMAGLSGLCLLNDLCTLVQKHGRTWSIFTGHFVWWITQKAFLCWR